jgi:hypothetical protein
MIRKNNLWLFETYMERIKCMIFSVKKVAAYSLQHDLKV